MGLNLLWQKKDKKDLKENYSLPEKCPNTGFFLVPIFLYSD